MGARGVRAVRGTGRALSAPTSSWLAVLWVRALLRIAGCCYLTGDVAGQCGRPEPLEFHARMAWGVHLDPGGSGVLPAHRAAVPDGHLPGRRWRWLASPALADGVVWLLGGAFDPQADTTERASGPRRPTGPTSS